MQAAKLQLLTQWQAPRQTYKAECSGPEAQNGRFFLHEEETGTIRVLRDNVVRKM
jgi:hypothetical protein